MSASAKNNYLWVTFPEEKDETGKLYNFFIDSTTVQKEVKKDGKKR